MRRWLVAGALLSVLVFPPVPPQWRGPGAIRPAAGEIPAPFTVVTIKGKGFGHGVGMAQDGIYSMGRANKSTTEMLAAFYPGTVIGKKGGQVRVVVSAASGPEAVLTFPNGGRIDAEGESRGFPVQASPGEQVRVAFENGRYVVGPTPAGEGTGGGTGTTTTTSDDGATTTTSGSTTTTTQPEITVPTSPASSPPVSASYRSAESAQPSSAGPLRATPAGGGTIALASGRRYRGIVEVKSDTGALRLVNAVDVETYLKGMGEVRDGSWPAAALRAQAIAARTYALRAMSFGGEICADQRCQVYLGAQAEYAAMNKAVADTSGQVVTHKGKLASTVYSANGGGHSATREEGFGTEGESYPYLRAAPYMTRDPLPWTERVSVEDVAAALGYKGELTDVKIARKGPSGRALAVELHGSAGRLEVTGRVFDARLGLKSTLFTLDTGQSSVPAPPRAGTFGGEQALPEEAVALPPRPPDPPLPDFATTTTTREKSSSVAAAGTRPPTPKSPGVAGPFALFLSAASAIAAAGYWLNRPRIGEAGRVADHGLMNSVLGWHARLRRPQS
ncbi:MAG TPA: SpoIID/LytB domain-containing protein [Acidimicrobiales bacterium]|nr:SpoIID/LytB domain-containing protein [Acidimicrobiales bacterium]